MKSLQNMAHVTPYKLQIQKQLMQPIIDLVKFYLIGNATPHPKKWTQNRKYTIVLALMKMIIKINNDGKCSSMVTRHRFKISA